MKEMEVKHATETRKLKTSLEAKHAQATQEIKTKFIGEHLQETQDIEAEHAAEILEMVHKLSSQKDSYEGQLKSIHKWVMECPLAQGNIPKKKLGSGILM
jgi:hypothetical protein